MAPKATPKTNVSDTRAETAKQNASLDIDFGTTMSEDDFERHIGPGPWQRKLDALFQGVEDGKGTVGKYVLIGTFKSASGANTAKNGITKRPDRLLRGSFEFKTRVVYEGDTKSSQLWAAVVADEDEPEA